jgi:hypothetical protein
MNIPQKRTVETLRAASLRWAGTQPCPYLSRRRQVRAESPIINSAGQRPAETDTCQSSALKGRNPGNAITPFQGLGECGLQARRALPYAIDDKAFSLTLTAETLRDTSLRRAGTQSCLYLSRRDDTFCSCIHVCTNDSARFYPFPKWEQEISPDFTRSQNGNERFLPISSVPKMGTRDFSRICSFPKNSGKKYLFF